MPLSLWQAPGDVTARSAWFVVFVGATVALFWTPLSLLIRLSQQQEHYSHIVLIPLVSAALFVRDRQQIFADVRTQWRTALGALLAAGLLYWLGRGHASSLSENDQLSIVMLAVVVVWIGGFVLCYGTGALRAGLFPALVLLLMVPIPDVVLRQTISWLQAGSAEVTNVLFQLVGVPVFRTGFLFELPGVTIEIAEECSGIRSSLALLITSLLGGHLFLRSAWSKLVLALTTLPLLFVKNGIRIVTLSLLSIYVDPDFLTGSLHQRGGIVFFLLTLAILVPVARLLQRNERRDATTGDA